MGSSCAYFIKKSLPDCHVTVIERDPGYEMCSTTLSVGGFRQQFSVKENIQMSLFSNSFFKNINEELGLTNKIDLQMFEEGYLTLSANKANTANLKENIALQRDLGAYTLLLNPSEVKEKFNWINVDDVEVATFGSKLEGWMDPWSLLSAFRTKAKEIGVSFVKGEIYGFEGENREIKKVLVKEDDGEVVEREGSSFVNSCGAWSGYINELMSLSTNRKDVSELPVVPKKRNVFVVKVQQRDAAFFDRFPLTFDSTGLWIRRDGRIGSSTFLVGKAPAKENDPSYFWQPSNEKGTLVGKSASYIECKEQLFAETELFESYCWEDLANRIPIFESCKVVGGWAGYYDYNLLDQNAILGYHTDFNNVLLATGFSGHGIQQSPSVGTAISELIAYGKFKTLDLRRFGFERIVENKPLLERNCY